MKFHPNAFSDLDKVASEALLANIKSMSHRRYLVAGGSQFASLWTRDFCFAARGLRLVGQGDVVRDQLDLILANFREADGLLPRVHDVQPSWWRVLKHTAGRHLPWPEGNHRGELRCEYLGEHRTRSLDSNALVVLAACEWIESCDDQQALSQWQPTLQKCLDAYEAWRGPDGLIHQGAFEDWQDSVRRNGSTFFVNLAFYLAARAWQRLGGKVQVPNWQSLQLPFYIEELGLYRTKTGEPHLALDAILMALDAEVWPTEEAREIFLRLKSQWHLGLAPGQPTTPNYPREWVSWTAKFAGLRHYHDEMIWSWLQALAGKVAVKLGDFEQAHQIFSQLQGWGARDRTIYEVYDTNTLRPVQTWIYRSESPFSWGAGVIIEALAEWRTVLSATKSVEP